MIRKLKGYMMPITMLVGAIFYTLFEHLSFLTPYLIFAMLFLTYSNLKLNEIRFSRLHIWLIVIQIFGSLAIFGIIYPFNPVLAEGLLICVMAPTAAASPVITALLKGSVASVTAYSLISNLSVALTAPIIFSFIGTNQQLPFFQSFFDILKPMLLLLILPLFLVLILRRVSTQVVQKIGTYSNLSFYLWNLSMMIVTARTVSFVAQQPAAGYATGLWLAAGSVLVCIGQFAVGRKIGMHYTDTIAGGQGLGQKNTILAIWMSQIYLNPVASIAPGAYVLWQNMVNSYQIWMVRKKL